jgi:hypothetical protein
VTRANEKVCFIGGAAHSGSTLLGLMLGAHPKVFYAGEAGKSRHLNNEKKPLRKRTCKVCGAECPVWGHLERMPGEDLYEALSRRTGRPIVADSTKSIGWLEEQITALGKTSAEPYFLFLGRDGRAVVASSARKYPETSIREHAEAWASQIAATEALAGKFPGPVARVRYEELATEPEKTVASITALLGIDLAPEMLAPWGTEQHPLGGNAGTQSLLRGAQTRVGGTLEISGEKRGYYEGHPRSVVLDLRWRRELSEQAIAEFDEVAGAVNRGYAWE